MESLQVVLLDLEKSVQCVICLGSLKSPVTTRCNHNFCDECIRKALKNKPEIPCPLCKKVVRLRSLKKATHLQTLISAVHKVTNQVQECADIPYTLSQSTREEAASLKLDANHGENELSHLGSAADVDTHPNCNGNTSGHDTDTNIVSNKTDSLVQKQHRNGTVLDAMSEVNNEKTVESKVSGDKQFVSNLNSPSNVPLNADLMKAGSGVGNTVTVTVDVHHSPMVSQLTASGNNTETHSFATGTTKPSNRIQQLPTIKLVQLNSHNNAVNGSAITSNTNDNSVFCEVIKDPFAFPLSQNPETGGGTTKKRNVKNASKKVQKYVLTKKRKSPSSEDIGNMKKKQKKSPNDSGKTDASTLTASVRYGETEKNTQKFKKKESGVAANDITRASSALKMIEEVENHKLTVEKVQVPKSPVKKVDRRRMKKEEKSPTKKKNFASSAMEENVKSKSPHLVRRLISVSSSSSESEMEQEVTRTVLSHEHSSQKTVNDKVSDWLETATTTCSSVHSSPSTQCEQKQTETLTSDDELLSHSQVSVEHIPDRVLIIKRRKISPAKFDPGIQKAVQNQLWNREKEVFGTQKTRNTFLSKNRKNLSSLWSHENTTSSEDGQLKDKISSAKQGKKSLKKQSRSEQTIHIQERERKTNRNATKDKPSSNEESIYNVQGLSQNISPFNTPTKIPDPKSPEKAYVLITPVPSSVTPVKSPANIDLLKESVKEIPLDQPSENYDIEDADEIEHLKEKVLNNKEVGKEFSDGFLQKVTEEGALEASNAIKDVIFDNLPNLNSSTDDHVMTVKEKANKTAKVILKEDASKSKLNKDEPMKVPAAPTTPSSRQGRNTRKTSTRLSTRSGLPLVGDSPTTQSTEKSIEPPVPVASASSVELGLLDFSEAMVLPPKTVGKIAVERPEVVAETCRMVLESLGEMKAMNLSLKDATEQEKIVTVPGRISKNVLRNAKSSKEEQISDCETDDSVIPPSTSTAEIAVPSTPPPCHLTRATYQSIEITADESDQKDGEMSIEGKTIEEGIVDHNLVADAKINRKKLTQSELSSETDDASEVDNDNDRGTMQCLSNGWGGTKLRIFKSASSAEFSDSNSNSSFTMKKQKKTKLNKGASGSKIFGPDVDSNVLHNDQQQNSDIIARSDNILQAEASADSLSKTDDKVFTESVDIIPNSDKMNDTNSVTETPVVQSVRKSTRKNKGRKQSFDFVTTTSSSKTKKEKTPNEAPDSTNEKVNTKLSTVEKSGPKSKIPEVNPVLKHIEAAIAHADTSYINWASGEGTLPENLVSSSLQGSGKKLPPTKSRSHTSPTKQQQKEVNEKLKKNPFPRKLPDNHLQRVPMGKRTKKNRAVLDNRKTSSADELKIQRSDYTSDDDYFSRSWPYEIRNQETFSCSLPHAVPKHITDVSVRLNRISQSQPSGLHPADEIPVVQPSNEDETDFVKIAEDKEVDFNDDLIEASPMMFETQPENEVGRSTEEKNMHGRSVNIDLREMNEPNTVSPDEVEFIHDDTDYAEDNEADDVICCSWNEEVDNQVGSRSASCHEETSSISSSEQQISQETKLHDFDVNSKDAKTNMQQKIKEEIHITDEYYKTAMDALCNMCNLEKKLLFENFPQSSSILCEAIKLCSKAKLSLDLEFSMQNLAKQTKKTKAAVKLNTAKSEMKRKRGRPLKKSRTNSAPVTKSLSQKGQTSKTRSSLRTAKKKANTNKEPVSATIDKVDAGLGVVEKTEKPDVTTVAKTADVDQDWKFEDDDMPMFDEVDDVLEFDTHVLDGELDKEQKGVHSRDDEPSSSKKINESNVEQDYLSKSMEEAMLGAEIETSEDHEISRTSQLKTSEIVEERMEMELDYMNDTVDPTPESPKKIDVVPSSPNAEGTDVFADKVDKWLRRLSDLNKKEGDEQKRKIGDKWTRTSDENSSVSSNNPAELLRKLDHEAAKAKGNFSKKSDNGSATSDSITKFMNELDQESMKSDSTTSKLIPKERCAQPRRLSFEEGELQQWIDSSAKNTDQNNLKMIPVGAKDIENGSDQLVTSSVRESQSHKSSQFASPSSRVIPKQPLQMEQHSKTKTNDDNKQLTSQNHGLEFEKLSQGSSKYSENMFNTKVVLEKLDLPMHDDVISASPPYPDTSYVSHRVAPKVERWLESSQPEAASPPTFESPIKEKLGFMSSGLQERGVHLVKMFANKYSGQFYSRFDKDNVTHIIVRSTEQRSCDRTLKYLQGIAAKKWIVSVKWVSDCLEQDIKLTEENFEIMGDNCMKEFESDGYEIPQGPMRSRTSPEDFKLLNNYRCVCLPPFSLITTEQATELLEMCGATVAKHLGDLITDSNDKSSPERQRIIIIDVEIVSDPPDYIAMGNQFGATVVSLEWMYESISRFEVQPPSEYTVTGFTQDSEITQHQD